MKVFVSWSGEQSHAIAQAFTTFLGDVIQGIKPFLSDHIKAGDRWLSQLNVQLEDTDFGVLCMTPDNLTAPWLLFEAGALSKRVGESFVCPYLFGVKKTDLPSALGQFQANTVDDSGTMNVIRCINDAMGNDKLESDKLNRSFERCYGDFKKALEAVPAASAPPPLDLNAAIVEILAAVRSRRPEHLYTPKYPRRIATKAIYFRGGPLDGKRFAVTNTPFWMALHDSIEKDLARGRRFGLINTVTHVSLIRVSITATGNEEHKEIARGAFVLPGGEWAALYEVSQLVKFPGGSRLDVRDIYADWVSELPVNVP